MRRTMDGRPLHRNVHRRPDGWHVTVHHGGYLTPATDVREYVYPTRALARQADISDAPGDRSGRIK